MSKFAFKTLIWRLIHKYAAREAAFKIAERRVRGCYVNHKAKGHMFEKVSKEKRHG